MMTEDLEARIFEAKVQNNNAYGMLLFAVRNELPDSERYAEAHRATSNRLYDLRMKYIDQQRGIIEK